MEIMPSLFILLFFGFLYATDSKHSCATLTTHFNIYMLSLFFSPKSKQSRSSPQYGVYDEAASCIRPQLAVSVKAFRSYESPSIKA